MILDTNVHQAAAIVERDRGWRSKLPALLNDILIALCARRIGATLVTYNGQDFRLTERLGATRLPGASRS